MNNYFFGDPPPETEPTDGFGDDSTHSDDWGDTENEGSEEE